jgi:hypothetical protein
MDLSGIGSFVGGAASGPIGLFLGGIFGLGQKYMDMRAEKLKSEERARDRAHELAVIDREADRAEVLANIKYNETVDAAQLTAMSASHKFDKATYSTGLIDRVSNKFVRGLLVTMMVSVDYFRGMVRPATTAYYQGLQLFLAVWATQVLSQAFSSGVLSFDVDQFALATLLKLVDATIAGAAATLAWYFTSRPNRSS